MNDINFTGHLNLFPIAVAKYRRDDHEALRQQILTIVDNCPEDNKENTEEGFLHYYNAGNFLHKNYQNLCHGCGPVLATMLKNF